MLLHLRLTVPSALTDEVVDLLRFADCSANLTLSRGASLSPEGDVVECDVARELAGEVIGRTGFIWHPDRWSFIAGAAGVLAMTTARANAMVGVFMYVTTIPAVGNFALALGVWAPSEIRGSVAQLGVNIAGMVLAGVVVLVLQRLLWVRTLAAAQRLFARGQRPTR